MKSAISLGLLALCAGSSLAAQEITRAERRAAELAPHEVEQRLQISGADDLSPIMTISTEPVSFKKFGDDQFLRARIDKAKGETEFQIYVIILGRDSLRPSRVNYIIDGQLHEVPAARVNFDVSCYRVNCTHIEHAVATISVEHVEAMSRCPEGERFFRLRVFGDYVEGRDLALACNEAGGLLLAIEKMAEKAKSG